MSFSSSRPWRSGATKRFVSFLISLNPFLSWAYTCGYFASRCNMELGVSGVMAIDLSLTGCLENDVIHLGCGG
jgi:hypothetical protein